MNDDNELGEVRESLIAEGDGLAGVHMDRPAQAVMARGQTLRLRRRLLRGLSGVTAASAALALALTLPGGAAAGFRQVHVNETGWSVNTSRHGTVTLVVREVPDPARLKYVLTLAGVAAEVHWGQTCGASVWTVPSERIVKAAYTFLPLPRYRSVPTPASRFTSQFTIHPALRPLHAQFVLGGWYAYKPLQHPIPALALVPYTAHLTCAKNFLTPVNPACIAGWHSVPGPLATPSLRVTPSPDPTPSPHATPSPDTTASPDSTPSPHATPSADSTPSPHATPSPDSTPSAHASPSPSATASPSATPSLSATCPPSAHVGQHKNSG